MEDCDEDAAAEEGVADEPPAATAAPDELEEGSTVVGAILLPDMKPAVVAAPVA